jgi:aminopeptidase N
MLESYVGAEAFKQGINAYLQSHAYGNATSEDFARSIAGISGKPVERILPTFVNQPGVPLLDVTVACASNQTAVTLTQQRFVIDGSRAESGRWQIPICVKVPGRASPVCEVMTDPSRTLNIAGACAPWVFANAGAKGYYRTAYPPEMLRALAPRVETDLTAPERLVLLDDEWSLVRAGRRASGDHLPLAAGYGARAHQRRARSGGAPLAAIGEDLVGDADRRLPGVHSLPLRPPFPTRSVRGRRGRQRDRRRLRA